MKHQLVFILLLFATTCLGTQSPKDFEGAWIGSASQIKGQSPQTWVFENIHGNTCTGYFWTGIRHTWSKCEVKDGELVVWWQGSDPALTGKIISSTQMELTWRDLANGVHTFTAAKQPPEYMKTLVDPRDLAAVDPGHMGIYHAVADMIMDNVKKNDMIAATKLSHVLEIVWDRSESDLQRKSPQSWGAADQAMDQLINPVMNYLKTPPDMAKVEAAYHTFLDRLQEAEAVK